MATSSPISTNTELEKKDRLDTNIVCMFTKVGATPGSDYILLQENANCPNVIARVKTAIERNLASTP